MRNCPHSPGDIVHDREQHSPDDAVVVNTPPVPVANWDLDGRYMTVAEDNPGYPADDHVVIVVYRETLDHHRPQYAGYQPLKLSKLHADNISFYAYPASRLETVDSLDPTTVALDDIQPTPYHARNFCYEANNEFIASTRERGYPVPAPVVRVIDDGYEVVNGHKRLWVAYIAGLEDIRAHVIYIDEWEAANRFVANHFDGSYSQAEADIAITRLRERWGDRVADLNIPSRYLQPAQSQEEQASM
jgi:ParB family chromosome partitioning protein